MPSLNLINNYLIQLAGIISTGSRIEKELVFCSMFQTIKEYNGRYDLQRWDGIIDQKRIEFEPRLKEHGMTLESDPLLLACSLGCLNLITVFLRWYGGNLTYIEAAVKCNQRQVVQIFFENPLIVNHLFEHGAENVLSCARESVDFDQLVTYIGGFSKEELAALTAAAQSPLKEHVQEYIDLFF